MPSATRYAEDDDQIDVSEIGRALLRQWRKIALVTTLAVLIALWSVLVMRPQFTVSGSLYLGDSQSANDAAGALQASGFNFLSDFQSVSDVDTQIQLIQAKALLETVILETGLNATITPNDTVDMPFWRWRFQGGERIDAFAPRPGDLRVVDATIADPGSGGAAFALVFAAGGRYQLFSEGGMFLSETAILSGTLNQPASGSGIAMMIKSPADNAVPPAGTRFMVSITPAKAVADALLNGPLAVSATGTGATPTNLAEISLACSNPFQGADFVNQLMADFIATQLSWKTQSASTTEAFVASQLSNIQTSLDAADRKLAAYQAKTGVVDVPADAQAAISQLSQYEVQRAAILLQKEALEQLALATAHPSDQVNPYLVSQTNDPLLGQLAQTLAQAEIQLQTQLVQYTGNAPEIQALEASIAKIKSAMRAAIQNDEKLAAGGIANLDALIAEYESQLRTMPAESLQVIALTRSSDVFGQLYVLLMQKEEEAEVSKAATIVNTRIVSPAEVPLRATRPKVGITVMSGLVLGLFAGIGLVLAERAVSGSFQSDEEIRRLVPLPVYGLIPKRTNQESSRGAFSSHLQSPFAEAFRLLRSNLYQSASGRESRLILITSAGSGDGKTTVASNLAKMLADDGRRVVLVDGDLYRGRTHEALKVNQAPGLTEWLVTTRPPGFQQVPEQRFLVLTSGIFPPNPSELLNEAALTDIIAALRVAFDFVIIDCPPLPSVSDTMTFGRHADLILSVVNIGHTVRRAFSVHNETLGTLDCNRGVVINCVLGNAYGYGYGYGRDYGYGNPAPVRWFDGVRKFLKSIWKS
jgi:tyrosine-protein kinase Etk/Wzc